MKFFQKRWVAITICVLMIVAALGIGQVKKNRTEYRPESSAAAESWGKENYGSYIRYIRDDVGLLSDSTIRELSQWNAAFDYSYDSICGVGIVEDLDGQTMEDTAFDLGYELGLGESDYFLLLDAAAEDWYFVYGDEAAYYVDSELEILVTGAMDEIFREPDAALLELFDGLNGWYADHVVTGQAVSGGSAGMVAGGTVLFVLLIVFLVIASVISALFRAGRRVAGGIGSWLPWLYLGSRRHRNHFRPGPGPGPNPGPRPGAGPRNPGGSSGSRRSAGGFGGSSRGNFSRGGGFGGGRRGGGGFGGKR